MKTEWKPLIRIGVSAFLLYLCIHYWDSLISLLKLILGAATPLLLGFMIAYIVNILMSFYEKHYFPAKGELKSRRPVCMLAAFVTLLAAMALLVWLVVPELISCAEILMEQIPKALSSVAAKLGSLHILSEDLSAALQQIDWESTVRKTLNLVASGAGNLLGTAASFASSVFSGAVTALFAFIFSLYLLSGKETLMRQAGKLVSRCISEAADRKIRHILNVLNTSFHNYIVGQCTEALILGGLCTLGMLVFRFPYATMTGAVIAFTALIPVAGGYIGAAVGAFMILTVSPMKALLFLIYIVILQQLENNLIYPKVVGSSIGLPAIWVLAAVTIGGGVMGIAGMLIGVPITATLYQLLRERLSAPKPIS